MIRFPAFPLRVDLGRRGFLRAASAATAAAAGLPVGAQEDVVRIVVPFPAGNPLDATARVLAECLRQTTRRSYIVDNKPGAAGIIGTSEVARARPDGSVLLFTTGGHNTNAVLYSKLPFDVRRDFTPITQLAVSPGFALLVRADSRFKTLAQLMDEAKARPGAVSYGSWGAGNTTHLIGALFARATGLDLLHIPYKGSPMQDVMAGHVDMTWFAASLSHQLVQEGKMRALAVTWPTRVPVLPTTPTLVELGIKDVFLPAWTGLYGPARMPGPVVQRLYADVVAASQRPEYLASMTTGGFAITNVAPQQFAALNAEELRQYQKSIVPLNITLD
jgi:tripartite-type tricarboxylate transporter receptor subunit TctC